MKLSTRIIIATTAIGSTVILALSTASAATFNQNDIIDDPVFDSTNSMSAGDINNFLNSFSNSCISPNSGFGAIDPNGYNPSSGYQYGGFVTAGQVIYDAAQAYGINPQVILTTLEKEQSLVTGRNNFAGYCNNGDQNKYTAAVGYGCPDSGTTYSYSGLSLYQRNGTTVSDTGTTCVNSASKAGFSQQVIRAAWLLKFGEQRSKGNISWAVIKGNWDNSDDPQTCYGGPMTQGTYARCPSGGSTYYDGYTTIDGTSVHMDTGATAALYWYTPHFSGNQSFFNIFSGWFGSTYQIGLALQNSLATNQIAQNTTLHAGDFIVSPNGKFVTTLQYDGNLVTYAGNKAVWNSNTRGGYNDYATFQSDGNFVIYSSSGSALWNSVTQQTGANNITLGDDGNLRIFAGTTQKYSTNNTVNSYATNNIGNQIQSVTKMNAGDYIQSPDGRFSMVMQADGNFVLYSADATALWWSGTYNHPGSYATMQADGNLVVYSPSGQALWNSRTYGQGASTLKLQNDGNLVVYNAGGGATWASGTWQNNYQVNTYVDNQLASGARLNPTSYLRSSDFRYTLVMQNDGNLVLFSARSYTPLWSSGTYGHPGSYATMQADGNLVVYSPSGQALWNSRTYGQGASTLKLQNDGNLVVYNAGNNATWNSGTFGKF